MLSTNPLLESFGNAKTLRNDNSSRFGKYITIKFSKTGNIYGASIANYLLEKTRIVEQAAGERNYHIFYELLFGADAELKSALCLNSSKYDWNYIQGEIDQDHVVSGRDEVEMFATTRGCLASLGLSEQTQTEIFKIIAAILHLGNVGFSETSAGGSDIDTGESESHLANVATLLKIEASDLATALTKRKLSVQENTIYQSQSVEQVSVYFSARPYSAWTCSLHSWGFLVRRLVTREMQWQNICIPTCLAG